MKNQYRINTGSLLLIILLLSGCSTFETNQRQLPVAIIPPPVPPVPTPIAANEPPPITVTTPIPVLSNNKLQNLVDLPIDSNLLLPSATTKSDVYPVLYGTSRKPIQKNGILSEFGDERNETLNYGVALINIPVGHNIGSLGKPNNFWEENFPKFFKNTNPELTVGNYGKLMTESEFIELAKSNFSQYKSDYVLLFIHGYNNSFEEALLRAGQLGFDLQVPKNNMYLFSWAAKHEIADYPFDEATIDASEIYLKQFLNSVIKAAGNKKINILAHSMGNRALLRVIASVSNDAEKKFDQIILAAADLDADVFTQNAEAYKKIARRTTIYLSPYDFAVGASQRIHAWPRVGCGDAPQVQIDGIDNVVAKLQESFPGHAYFAEKFPILNDIRSLILSNQPYRPTSKDGGEWIYHAANGENREYWTIGDDKKLDLCTANHSPP